MTDFLDRLDEQAQELMQQGCPRCTGSTFPACRHEDADLGRKLSPLHRLYVSSLAT